MSVLSPTTEIQDDARANQGTVRGAAMPAQSLKNAVDQTYSHQPASNINDHISPHEHVEGFAPQLIDKKSGSKNMFGRLLHMDGFPGLSTYGSYYNEYRTLGYVAAALVPQFIGNVSQLMTEEHIKSYGKLPQQLKNIQEPLIKLIQNSPLEEFYENNYGKNVEGKGKTRNNRIKDNAQRHVLMAEGVAFGLLAGHAFMQEKKALLDNCRLALGAELGKDKDDISIIDLFKSDNPLIQTETNRLLWKTISRMGSSAAFFGGMRPGMVAMALNIGAERTIFYKKTAYDDVVRIVNDAQFNHLEGNVTRDALINDLQRSIQSVQINHERDPVNELDMQALRPVLEKISEDIIDKKIGVESLIGIIGGGILILGDPAQSAANYAHVRQRGFEGIARDALALRQEHGLEEGQVWDKRRYTGSNYQPPSDIASSARPDKLMQERLRYENRTSHYGLSSR